MKARYWKRGLWAALSIGAISLTAGCGGGGGASGGDGAPAPAPLNEPVSIGRVRINVDSGKTSFQPLTPDGRSLATGNSWYLESGQVQIEAGERGRYLGFLQGKMRSFSAVSGPMKLVFEKVTAGNADPGNDKPYNMVTTYAGTPSNSGFVNGEKGVGRIAAPLQVEILESSLGPDKLAISTTARVATVSKTGVLNYIYTVPPAVTINDMMVDLDHIWVALSNHTIAKIDPDTGSTSIIGSAGVSGHVAGSGSVARLNNPLIIDRSFVIDANGFRPFSSTTGTASLSTFVPASSVLDANAIVNGSDWGAPYIGARPSNNRISLFNSTTSARPNIGSSVAGAANGLGDVASFNIPNGVDQLGGLAVVADSGNSLLRGITFLDNGLNADSRGYFVSTLAGTGVNGFTDGIGTVARFNQPNDVCIDEEDGDIYVADTLNHIIRRVQRNMAWPTLAQLGGGVSAQPVGFPDAKFLPNPSGQSSPYFEITPSGSGFSTLFQFTLPEGANVFEADIVILGESGYEAVLQGVLNPAGTDVTGSSRTAIRTVAGRTGPGGYGDGDSNTAIFGGIMAAAYDGSKNLYIADKVNGVIRRRGSDGNYKTIIGDPFNTSTVPATGNGLVEAGVPEDIAVSADGRTIWWTDATNHLVRRARYDSVIGPSEENPLAWSVATLYGLAATPGDAVGIGTTARLRNPSGIAYDPSSRMVYIADEGNHRIKRFSGDIAGPLTNFVGSGVAGSLNGSGVAASFNSPNDVAVSPLGEIIVADTLNRTIRKVTLNGTASLLAGVAGAGFLQDGATGATSRFNTPSSLAVDSTGYIYVLDQRVGHVIRRVSPIGETKTCVGQSAVNAAVDGFGNTGSFTLGSSSICLTPGNELLVCNGNLIREVHHVISSDTP